MVEDCVGELLASRPFPDDSLEQQFAGHYVTGNLYITDTGNNRVVKLAAAQEPQLIDFADSRTGAASF